MSIRKFVTILIIITFLLLQQIVYAEEYEYPQDTVYSDETIILISHSEPEDFFVTETGEMFGVTTDGHSFSQTNISNDTTRLQKFQIQEVWWYISDKGIIGYGERLSNIQALSIYLTME